MVRPARVFRRYRAVRSIPAQTPRPTSSRRANLVAVGALVASTAFTGRPAAAEPAPVRAQSLMGSARQVAVARQFPAWWAPVMAQRATGAAQPDGPATYLLDLPAGALDATLAAFERETRIRVDAGRIPADTLSMMQSPGARGELTGDAALTALLTGTGLGFKATGPATVEIQVRAAEEFVTVSGRSRRLESPKLTEPLREIPQTITVIPASIIAEQNATTLRDVLRNVSGITFQAGEGGVPAGDQLSIRGFSARTDMFIDGVRDFGGYSRDAFNLEQVEVSKGPSSSIVGRGSTGGVINQVSKTPTREPRDEITVGAGSAEYVRSTIDLNHPIEGLGSNTAVRLNAMWTHADVPERDVVGGERWGVAPSLAFGLGTGRRLTVSYFHLRQHHVPDYGIPWVPANSNPELAAHSNGRPPVGRSSYYGLVARDYEDTTTDVATVTLDTVLTDLLSLRNLTRWGQNTRDSVITAPRFASVNTSTAINRQLQSRDMEDGIVANMTNLTARLRTGRLSHAVTGGVEVAHETSENFARTGPTAPRTDLFSPDPFDPYPGPIVRSGASTRGTANSVAAYLFDTVDLGAQWEVTGGLRWDRFDVDTTAIAVGGVTTDLGRTDNLLSWRGGAVYKPRANGSVYMGVGTSFNPSAEGLSLTAITATVAPEKTVSYEVGTKWDVQGERLSLTAAVFRTDKTNARTPGVNPLDPPTVLDGEQRVQGFELGLSGTITRRWSAFAGYAHMTGDIVASNTAGEVGHSLALVPENTMSIWTTYTLPGNFAIGGGAQFMDSVFRNATNVAVVPSYWLINGTASYEVNQFLTLRVNGTNLANENYVDRVGGGHFIPGAGRSLSLSATLRR